MSDKQKSVYSSLFTFIFLRARKKPLQSKKMDDLISWCLLFIILLNYLRGGGCFDLLLLLFWFFFSNWNCFITDFPVRQFMYHLWNKVRNRISEFWDWLILATFNHETETDIYLIYIFTMWRNSRINNTKLLKGI